MLTVSNLTKGFTTDKSAKETILKDVSFDIRQGEIVSITGKSGVGKSTITRIICGMLTADSGEIYYNEKLLVSNSKSFPTNMRREIQLIPQQPISALDPKQRIGEAISEVLRCHGIAKSSREASKLVLKLLEQVWLPAEIAMRYPSQISGGQAQRAVIARAIGLSPSLLIADEATSMLDVPAQAQVVSLFKEFVTQKGISILLISHDKSLVQALSKHTYHLEDAKLLKIH